MRRHSLQVDGCHLAGGAVFFTRRTVFILMLAVPIIGYGATRVSDAPMDDVLLAGMVLLSFGAWRRWGRFRGEKNVNKRLWFCRTRRFFKGF